MIQRVALTLDDTYAAPAPVIKHESSAPDSRINRDTRGLVNPQFLYSLWRHLLHKSLVLFLPWTRPLCPLRSQGVLSVRSDRVRGTCTFVIEPSPAELFALESLQNIIHEKQMEVDRCVLVLKCETEKLRLLEECSFVPPRGIEEL